MWATEKRPRFLTFHWNIGCLIGILIMVYEIIPILTGQYNPMYTLNNQVFCSLLMLVFISSEVEPFSGALSMFKVKDWIYLDLPGIFHSNVYIYTLPKTNSSPLKIGHPKRKLSSSNHPFSGAKMLVSGYIIRKAEVGKFGGEVPYLTTFLGWPRMRSRFSRWTNIFYLGKRKIIFNQAFGGDMLLPRRIP